VAALADRLDGRPGRADQLADRAVRNLRMVADDPRDAVRLVLALGHRRVARALGAADWLWALEHLQAIIGIALALVDFVHRDFMGAHRIAAGIFGCGGIVGDRLHFEDMEPAKFRDLVETERGVVDEPAGGRMGHEGLGHGNILRH
jgi:hypothetical protein